MKTINLIRNLNRHVFTWLLVAPVSLFSADTQINWTEPETYSDVDDGNYFSENLYERFSEEITDHISDEADHYLPSDYQLNLNIRDVDLAGEHEFWLGATYADTRIMRDIYPPRLKFEYTLKNGEGETVKKGMAQVTDQMYLWNVGATAYRTDRFYYEKELISDWMRRNLDDIAS